MQSCKKMAEILKFVYNAILFISLYFIVIYSESKFILLLFFYLRQHISLIFSNISLSLFTLQ